MERKHRRRIPGDMGWIIVILLQTGLTNGGRRDRIYSMAYSIIWVDWAWTRTMARPLNRLDLPFELSFGAAAIRRRNWLFTTRDKATISLGRSLTL